ncbi:septal ring lytic transglycosylase RlpA family protein [Marivibrio halodurans]|uniref:Endolytic peptidoglycan transglycosylase RlpA n=1 Tax=Marivibrio halodurans TaxID=2039722 RepID=A0A8J7RYU6_9PROT|nr:septal ring lytic transglycosylase RlpA family protein [Marivibrio halodurans]
MKQRGIARATQNLRLSSAVGLIVAAALVIGGCAEVQFVSQAAKQIGGGTPTAPADPDAAGNGTSYKIGKAYQIKNIWYYPREDEEYVEEGIASWYGPNFHGKPTANGAIFDQWKVSAAHRTLPMPSIVRVTNLENGRSLKVKVNDRGPFSQNRIIDLSRKAAQLLGFEQKGTALVRVELLAEESRKLAAFMQGRGPRPTIAALGQPGAAAASTAPSTNAGREEVPAPEAAPAPDVDSEDLAAPPGVEVAAAEGTAYNVDLRGRPSSPDQIERAPLDEQPVGEESLSVVPVSPNPDIFIQAGAFAQHVNAIQAQARLRPLGPVVIQQINKSETPLFRVRIGPIKEVDRADMLLASVQDAGFNDAHIVVND